MVLGLSIDHQAALRPMPVTQRDLERRRPDYEDTLPDPLDCVHLGLGPDGHTASLVPGDPVLEVSDRRVALTETAYQGHRRMTLTYPALAAARQIVWLVTGRESASPWPSCSPATPRSRPAGSRTTNMIVVADEAAAPIRKWPAAHGISPHLSDIDHTRVGSMSDPANARYSGERLAWLVQFSLGNRNGFRFRCVAGMASASSNSCRNASPRFSGVASRHSSAASPLLSGAGSTRLFMCA